MAKPNRCRHCDGIGGIVVMIPGVPGYFVAVPCAGGCLYRGESCLVCSRVGRASCVAHSKAPFTKIRQPKQIFAVRRCHGDEWEDIRSACGDISEFLSLGNLF